MPAKQISLLSPAKLNLFLHITGRRPDGYHNLQTIFQILDWGDQISFTTNTHKGLRLTCSDASLETHDNLILKAARLLEQTTAVALNADIHLEKLTPMGGGIGGGSSNAATTLLALNHIANLGLSHPELLALGRQLGADVPVFVNGETAWADGIGEVLTAVEIPQQWYVIVNPGVHVSTATLFSHPELTRNTAVSTIRLDLADTGRNDFENLVRRLYPKIEDAFQAVSQYGKPKLTGTGACLFLTMPDENSAQKCQQELAAGYPQFRVYCAKGVLKSSVMPALGIKSTNNTE